MWRRSGNAKGSRQGAPTPAAADQALVSIYRRPEGYYLVRACITTAGVWLDPPRPPTTLVSDASAGGVGAQVLALLDSPTELVDHPARGEWTERTRAARLPLLREAKVRSTSQFLANASLVSVERSGEGVTVSPMRPMAKPAGAFEGDIEHTSVLVGPTGAELGTVILACLS